MNNRLFKKGLLVLLTMPWLVTGADWPTYMADPSRSGVTTDSLPPILTTTWTFRSLYPPRPAWQGEAKWDGYNKVYDMKARQIFDRAFHVAIGEDLVFFGSSADDKIYALEAATGREVWSQYTEGPVRLAPTYHKGKLLTGSDDGWVYCHRASDGELLWRTRPAPEDVRVPGNGRMISLWPIRTGVVIYDDKAYCGAGMFPSETVYLASLDLETGKVIWQSGQTDLPAQGYVLASNEHLYFPAGRNNPVVLNRADGKRVRVVEGSGGTYALLTGDFLIFGPGKTGQLGVVESESSDQLASFEGNHMIVTQGKSYLHSDTGLSALDRTRYLQIIRDRKALQDKQGAAHKRLNELKKKDPTTLEASDQTTLRALQKVILDLGTQIDLLTTTLPDCFLWKINCDFPYSMIMAGDHIVLGGDHKVAAFEARTGQKTWEDKVDGNAYGLAASNGRLYVSTDKGFVHCFAQSDKPVSQASVQ